MNWKVFTVVLGCIVIFGKSTMAQATEAPKIMVLIPAGEFTMGSPKDAGSTDEQPQHKVYLDAFNIDPYPVTNQEFQNFVNATGYVTDAEKNGGGYIYDCSGEPLFVIHASANWKDPNGDKKGILDKMDNPVVQVDWYDANAFAKWAGKRLPTEAEYEKAARGKATTLYFFGDNPSPLSAYAWFKDNSVSTHSVGALKPNPYGLYDIVGNVWEWCSDWYDDNYYSASAAKNPQGPTLGKYRVLRGGSWIGNSDYERTADRHSNSPDYRSYNIGFRCVKMP
jgi:formylglycine-generating enzyme